MLSLPPAFNLSHDQTLQFNLAMKLFKEASKLGSSNLAITLSYVSYNELTLSFLAVLNDNFYS